MESVRYKFVYTEMLLEFLKNGIPTLRKLDFGDKSSSIHWIMEARVLIKSN